MFKDQKQEITQGGTAIQAGGSVSVVYSGLTYAEVKEVALDVFKANFYELSGQASDIAKARAEQITEDFLSKLNAENPSGLNKANDPDFQYSLFTIQREYARTGDKDLGHLLVDLLVDRSKHEQRDILQIVLNESLNTAPKLTDNQLAILSIVFLFESTQDPSLIDYHGLGLYFDTKVLPFLDKLKKNNSLYQHLEFCGCASKKPLPARLEFIIGSTYQGFFMKGFEKNEISKRGISDALSSEFFIPCMNDKSLYQVSRLNKDILEKNLGLFEMSLAERKDILELFEMNKMSEDEIKAKCIEIRPYMADLFDIWSSSYMRFLTLTSVGIAIGHANVKRSIGKFSDLSNWIN